jgi:hypothetical protein
MPASWQSSASIPVSFPDGTSQTILFAEKYAQCNDGGTLWGRALPDLWSPTFGAWSSSKFQVRPLASECNPALASTPYSGGITVGLADGSGRTLSTAISEATWKAACTPAGGEVLGSDW